MTQFGWGDAFYLKIWKEPFDNANIESKIDKHNIFNNSNSKTNGEFLFYNQIKNNINTIFDISCRNDSEFLDFNGEVHYFDPMSEFIENLSKQPHKNRMCFFNTFGLGNEDKNLYYYPKYQSFYDRVNSCKISDDLNKITLSIKKGKEYMIEKNIQKIDLLKIDTEGYEFMVLQGFENFLKNIKIIQFEYGGTFLDNNVKLLEVVDYLRKFGFSDFSYLSPLGTVLIEDFNDHYQYCNIVCINKNF